MKRETYIEKFLRQVYGDFPTDDSSISPNLVNVWLSEGVAIAAKQNYKDNISIDGIDFVNNGFYTTFKGIAVQVDEQNLWKVELPEIPIGIGDNMGVSRMQFKGTGEEAIVSPPVIFINENQATYFQRMRSIPNKVLCYQNGKFVYVFTTVVMTQYTATVTMVSGGDATDLTSELNVPPDYLPIIDEYLFKQLNTERNQPVDVQNDGLDAVRST